MQAVAWPPPHVLFWRALPAGGRFCSRSKHACATASHRCLTSSELDCRRAISVGTSRRVDNLRTALSYPKPHGAPLVQQPAPRASANRRGVHPSETGEVASSGSANREPQIDVSSGPRVNTRGLRSVDCNSGASGSVLGASNGWPWIRWTERSEVFRRYSGRP